MPGKIVKLLQLESLWNSLPRSVLFPSMNRPQFIDPFSINIWGCLKYCYCEHSYPSPVVHVSTHLFGAYPQEYDCWAVVVIEIKQVSLIE